MKKTILSLLFLILLVPFVGLAAESGSAEQVFEAKVIKVLEEKTVTNQDGSTSVQQNLKLKPLEGHWQDKEIKTKGISDIQVFKSIQVEKGDKVMVTASIDPDGQEVFYVTDHVRRGWLYFLALIFAVLMIAVGRKKGFKALISLVATFVIIVWFIIPRILAGANPLLISIIGSLIILGAIIYITWGLSKKAHLAMAGIFISLMITGIFSLIFTKLTNLTGLAQDDAMFLVGLSSGQINFQGLLLAGIIIGALGVLDDVVISQISTVEQIKAANDKMKPLEIFKSAMSVGVDHISSMTNTLFLAYAGAALPLLILFTSGESQSLGFSEAINNEVIATEIVRTLTGSIGLILAVPIATILAVKGLVKNQD